jgi:hypothetical protein
MVLSQPRQIVCKTLSQKNPSQKRAGGVSQGVSPEFKPQYRKKKKNRVRCFTNCPAIKLLSGTVANWGWWPPCSSWDTGDHGPWQGWCCHSGGVHSGSPAHCATTLVAWQPSQVLSRLDTVGEVREAHGIDERCCHAVTDRWRLHVLKGPSWPQDPRSACWSGYRRTPWSSCSRSSSTVALPFPSWSPGSSSANDPTFS